MSQFILGDITTAGIVAILSMVLGFVWYGPLFGRRWLAVMGMAHMTDAEIRDGQKKMGPRYLLQFIASLVQFFAFAFVSVFIGPLNMAGAIMFALIIWAGFVLPIEVGNALWSGKSNKLAWQLFALTAGYQLVCFILAGITWALVFPHFY